MDLKLWEYIFEMFNYKIRQKKSIFFKITNPYPALNVRAHRHRCQSPPSYIHDISSTDLLFFFLARIRVLIFHSFYYTRTNIAHALILYEESRAHQEQQSIIQDLIVAYYTISLEHAKQSQEDLNSLMRYTALSLTLQRPVMCRRICTELVHYFVGLILLQYNVSRRERSLCGYAILSPDSLCGILVFVTIQWYAEKGLRKNVLKKLFSVKRMLGNVNDFFIFID